MCVCGLDLCPTANNCTVVLGEAASDDSSSSSSGSGAGMAVGVTLAILALALLFALVLVLVARKRKRKQPHNIVRYLLKTACRVYGTSVSD